MPTSRSTLNIWVWSVNKKKLLLWDRSKKHMLPIAIPKKKILSKTILPVDSNQESPAETDLKRFKAAKGKFSQLLWGVFKVFRKKPKSQCLWGVFSVVRTCWRTVSDGMRAGATSRDKWQRWHQESTSVHSCIPQPYPLKNVNMPDRRMVFQNNHSWASLNPICYFKLDTQNELKKKNREGNRIQIFKIRPVFEK